MMSNVTWSFDSVGLLMTVPIARSQMRKWMLLLLLMLGIFPLRLVVGYRWLRHSDSPSSSWRLSLHKLEALSVLHCRLILSKI